MVKESRKDQYRVDAFYLRYFQRFPQGVNLDDITETEKVFYIYLMASAPSIDNMITILDYERRLEAINETDFTKKVELRPEIIEMVAYSKGITKEQYIQEQAEQLKEDAIESLKERFGIVDDENDERDEEQKEIDKVRSFYRKRLEQMKNGNVESIIKESPKNGKA